MSTLVALIERAAGWLAAARNVCVLTGAGVSAESGLDTFRGAGGLWNGRPVEEVATPRGFARDPRRVWQFYNWRRRELRRVQPNPGHFALADLETRFPHFGLITQNVDRLHQRAGSHCLVEIHGNIAEVRCTACLFIEDRGGQELPDEPRCPRCGEWLRPCVVWFEELLPPEALRTAEAWLTACDLFLSVGTSGNVWPASGFAEHARQNGARVIEINLEPTPLTSSADIALLGRSGEILPQLVAARPKPCS